MNNNYWKIFTGLAFVAFAAISCWATAESLHFSLPNWPVPACWVISVGFFVIASIGTTLIVNSLNQKIDMDNRGWIFVGGLLMTLVFWLVCSMPTNTHTFFYRSDINGVVNDDISKTENYLNQLVNAKKVTDSIENEYKVLEKKLRGLKTDLYDEIVNNWNRGVGPEAKRIMNEIERVSGVNIKELSKTQNLASRNDAEKLANIYKAKVDDIIKSKEDEKNRVIKEQKDAALYVKNAKKDLNNLRNAKIAIDSGAIVLINADHMEALTKVLASGYSTIGNNSQWVTFSSSEDKDLYTVVNPVSKTKSMIDVFTVWKDFLHGKYRGHGLWYWVIISILLDIAAFIFFDITFAKRDDA